MQNLFEKVRSTFLHNDKRKKDFIDHNKEVFSSPNSDSMKGGVVLIELNNMASAIISYSYLAAVLERKYNATIVAYSTIEITDTRLNWFRKNIEEFDKSLFKIYESFGVEKVVVPRLDKPLSESALVLFNKIKDGLSTKQDVEDIVVDNVILGDLFYDTYLRDFRVPTVDLSSSQFDRSLLSSIRKYVFWKDYFEKNTVCAVNVSHCGYTLAIPLRIAVSRSIPAYQINATDFYRMNEKSLFAYGDFRIYPEMFKALPAPEQERGIDEARRRLERRFFGEVAVDMSYSSKSAFGGVEKTTVLKKSDKRKILVATHCLCSFDTIKIAYSSR